MSSINWGLEVVRVDLDVKDMATQIKRAFVNRVLTTVRHTEITTMGIGMGLNTGITIGNNGQLLALQNY